MKRISPVRILSCLSILLLILGTSGCASRAPQVPMSMNGGASDALVTLATTGNPDPLQKELGGDIISSKELEIMAAPVLDLARDEHLAPKALVPPSGEMYAMVAPTLTKDNFIYVDASGNLMRMDVGASEGHRIPFVVHEIMADGGTPWYQEFWWWLTGQ